MKLIKYALLKGSLVLGLFLCSTLQQAQAQTIAILDQGVNPDDAPFPANIIVDQMCFSVADQTEDIPINWFRNGVPTGQSGIARWARKLSLCKNGVIRDLTSSDAAELPRQFIFSLSPTRSLADYGKPLLHGNRVIGAAYDFSPNVKQLVIQTTHFNGERTYQRGSKNLNCRANIDEFTPHVSECYSIGAGDTWARALEYLSRNPSGIGANGIDFFASGFSGFHFGNSYSSPRVAAAMSLLYQANPSATIVQKMAALTEASTSNATAANITRPIIRNRDIAKAIEIITNGSGTPPSTAPGGIPPTDPTPISRPPTPAGQTASLGITDDTLYKKAVTFFVNLNGSASPTVKASSNVNIPVSDLRDIKLDFDGLFYTSANPSSLAGIDIVVNGVPRITFNSLIHSTHQRFYRKHSFMLNRNWLKSGNNTIEIKKSRLNRSGMTMRVTKVRMEYNAPVAMRFGDSVSSLYGHRVGSKRHLTGMRVIFSGSQSDVDFSVRGFDIDTNTEIAVFLNNIRVGYLNRSANGGYNTGNNFKFRKDDLISSGINTIEFVQTSSSDSETWGVSNLKLDGASPDISGIIMMLLSDG